MSGLQDWVEKSKALDASKAKKGQHFDLGWFKNGRKVVATYMGGSRWKITVLKAS